MQTYTHLALTHLFNRRLRAAGALPPLDAQMALLGSVAPDIPLIAISVVFIGWDRLDDSRERTRHLYEEMFFHDWRIKLAHNLFHAPLPALCAALLGYGIWQRGRQSGGRLFWFAAATLVHTLIDIPLHHNDGPLLLFPFDWQRRYNSRFSYWDPAHYGKPLALAEHLLLLICLLYLRRMNKTAGRV